MLVALHCFQKLELKNLTLRYLQMHNLLHTVVLQERGKRKVELVYLGPDYLNLFLWMDGDSMYGAKYYIRVSPHAPTNSLSIFHEY